MEATSAEIEDRAARGSRFDPNELRGALLETLEEVRRDETVAARLRAVGVHLCLALDEFDERLEIGSSSDPDEVIAWRFLAPDESPREGALELAMGAETANRWLLGRESLPVAVARGRARVSGGASAALAALPAVRLISEPYRKLVGTSFPGLAGDRTRPL
ncbi:hypothetical protein HJD18_11150 [Thermoleophilia bacterium SCSIO 60948]|nr:hypothetical protein HJD18_11150 [Thermoleophilia bacterium SCSIO 60948]